MGLAAGRISIGAGLWLAPNATLSVLGFGRLEGEALALARIAGVRDIALGAWMVDARDDRARLARAATAVAACDAGDTAAFGLLARAGGNDARAGLFGAATAAPATAMGVALASRLARRG